MKAPKEFVEHIEDMKKCDRCHLLEATLIVVQDKMLYKSVIWELIEKVIKKGK